MNGNEDFYYSIHEKLRTNSLIVCIGGASCSGKSTLAKNICQAFEDADPVIICQDNWFKDINCMPKNRLGYYNMETIEAFHTEEFKHDMETLVKIGHTMIPRYDFKTNKRMAKDNAVNRSKLVIIEGLHVPLLLKDFDVACSCNMVFAMIETDVSVCAERRALRDIQFINRELDFFVNHYKKVIYPNYADYIPQQKIIVKDKKGFIIRT